MSRLCILLCRVEDEDRPDELLELHRVDLPAVDVAQLAPDTALDTLEAQALTTGNEVMRHLLGHQWQEVDRHLAAAAQRLSPPRDHQVRRQ